MRSAEQKMLNAVQRPEVCREVVPRSAAARIVLSAWGERAGTPVVLFLPGTMTHPLFYEEFLDALNRAGLTVVGLHGQGHHPAVLAAFRAAAHIAPTVPVPFGACFGIRRICRDASTAEDFHTDPLGRRSYPLRFLGSLFTADLGGMRDGCITCPVTVIAARGDSLFPLAYIREVFGLMVAPHEEMLVLDSGVRLLINEDLTTVLPPLLERLQAVVPAHKGAPP